MNLIKPFIADAARDKSLALAYLRFPEMTEVFQNVLKNKSLSENVLSEWDAETLEGHIRQFILPNLLDAGAIYKDDTKSCGYSSQFSDLSFVNLSRPQLATVAAKKALLISNSVEVTDSRDDVISANLHFHRLPDHLRSELLGSLRSLLTKYMQDIPDSFTEGRQFRLALVARAEK